MVRFIFIIYLLSAAQLFSSDFTGFVFDEETKTPLAGVTVRIDGAAYGCFSDKSGKFIISNIPSGRFKAVLTMIGYELKTIMILFPDDDKKEFSINLKQQSLRTNEVVVSANKRVQQVQEVPVSVSTIDLNTLRQKNITDIDQALEYIPGVQMNGDQVSIRGSSGFAFGLGSRVAYLLDGFPILSGDQGDMKFDIIPIFNIENIEVVKGAGSALYGTGALGGIVNIISENPKQDGELKAKLYSGFYTKPKYKEWVYSESYSFNNGIDLSYSNKFDDLGFLVSSRILNDDSYRDFDERLNWNIFAKLDYKLSDINSLTITGNHAFNVHQDWVYWRGLDSATIPPADVDQNLKVFSEKSSINTNFKQIFENGDFLIIRNSIYRTFFTNKLDESNTDYRSSTAYSLNNEIQLNNRFSEGFFLTSGVSYLYNTAEANIYGNNQQKTIACYSQLEVNLFEQLILTGGMRFDFEKTSGTKENYELSPKFGALYKASDWMNFRLSVGKGFRTATIAEKFAALNYGPFKVKPNPNIQPESSWSYEIGMNSDFHFENSTILLDIAVFQNDLSKMIEAMFVQSEGEPFIRFDNVTKARIRGIEIGVKSFLFGLLGIQSSITYMDPVDLTNENKSGTLKYRSKILWYSGVMMPIEFLEFQADYRFISKPETVDDLLSLYIKDADARVNAHVVDARIIFNLKNFIDNDITLTLNAHNLLDYYYTLYPGNLAPTRSITLQLDAKF